MSGLPHIGPKIETLRGEGLKTGAEMSLSILGQTELGRDILERYAFGPDGRINEPGLHTTVAGLDFENPVMVGAGWDKRGRCVQGLYALGFSGVEVGTVLLFGQRGNPKPRLSTLDRRHSVGHNALGFNSIGSEQVDETLIAASPFPCPVGINIGRNKLTTDSFSPEAHAEVVKRLYPHASYFVFNPSSPNTEGLRKAQHGQFLKDHIVAMQEASKSAGGKKPLYVKLAPDITTSGLHDIVRTSVESGVAGIVLVNTTISAAIKAKYGMAPTRPGGISGNDWEYRSIANHMAFEIYQEAGDRLEIIGVGGISTAEHAIERMMAGASIVQVVTAIREHKGRVAAQINTDIVEWMNRNGVKSIKEIIGAGTHRGAKYPKA